MKKVNKDNLILNGRVIDTDNNIGTLVCIDDVHNIEVDFDCGGVGFWCLDEWCESFDDTLYYIDNDDIDRKIKSHYQLLNLAEHKKEFETINKIEKIINNFKKELWGN